MAPLPRVASCRGRSHRMPMLEVLAPHTQAAMQDSADREISSGELGNMVMSRLRQLDQVAYVRFASVYRRFEDVEEFLKELMQLRDQDG